MATAGRLTGPTLTLDDGTVFQAGDRIVCLRNDRPAGLVNGLRGTVTGVHADATLTVVDDHGTDHTIPARYLDAGHVAHGYAITGHKAQGLTVDHTFVLGSDALYREWGYVAMSRGRESNQLYVHTTDDMQPDAHLRPTPGDPVAATVTRLSRSRAEQPVAPTLGQQLRDIDQYLVSPTARHAQTLHNQHARLIGEQRHLEQHRDRLQRQSDSHGVALSRRARADRRQLADDLVQVTSRLDQIDRDLAQVDRALVGLPTRDDLDDALDQHRQLTRDLDRAARRLTRHALDQPPAHLTDTLGPLPTDPRDRHGWRDAAHAIHRYRIAWDITDPTHALGASPPIDPDQRDALARVATAIDDHHTRTLDHSLDHDITRGFGLSR